jgi:hypothetical protein
MADLMVTLQQYLTGWNYPWLHPNYVTLIAKSSAEVSVTLAVEYQQNLKLSLNVKMANGSPEEFTKFVDSLRLLLRDEIEMDEAVPLTEANRVHELARGTSGDFDTELSDPECNPM